MFNMKKFHYLLYIIPINALAIILLYTSAFFNTNLEEYNNAKKFRLQVLEDVNNNMSMIKQRHENKHIVENPTQPVGQIMSFNNHRYVDGTAFIIDKNTIITNKHVIQGEPLKHMYFVPQMSGWDESFNKKEAFKVTHISNVKDRDLAVIKIKGDLSKYGKYQLTSKLPKHFEEVTTFGYPFENKKLEAEMYQSTIPYIEHDKKDVYLGYQSKQGGSGSPIINKDGKVFAVATYGLKTETTYKNKTKTNYRNISGGTYLSNDVIKEINTLKDNPK